jgi:hypothetical protein
MARHHPVVFVYFWLAYIQRIQVLVNGGRVALQVIPLQNVLGDCGLVRLRILKLCILQTLPFISDTKNAGAFHSPKNLMRRALSLGRSPSFSRDVRFLRYLLISGGGV